MTHRPAPSGASDMQPVLARLQSLGPCPPGLEAQVLAHVGRVEMVSAGTVVCSEETPARRTRHLLAGWACRYRHVSGGRRQIFDVVLPGDQVGVHLWARPLARTDIQALTPLRMVDTTALVLDDHILAGVPVSRAQADADEERALRQIVRLGCMSALERLADLFCDLRERLEVVDLDDVGRFACPLTQQVLADMTGLSVVHVNRVLKELRRRRLVVFERGWVQLGDAKLLAEVMDVER